VSVFVSVSVSVCVFCMGFFYVLVANVQLFTDRSAPREHHAALWNFMMCPRLSAAMQECVVN